MLSMTALATNKNASKFQNSLIFPSNKGDEGCEEMWACCKKPVENEGCGWRYTCCQMDMGKSRADGSEVLEKFQSHLVSPVRILGAECLLSDGYG